MGLLVAYLLSLAALHWLAPALYLLPWDGEVDLDATLEGLRQSTFAIMALGVGAEVAARQEIRTIGTEEVGPDARIPSRLVNMYLVSGASLYVALFSAGSRLPTVRALVSCGSALMVVGIALKCWNAWQEGKTWRLWSWLGAALGLPVMTVLSQGFLGYGYAAMLMVVTFCISFRQWSWKAVALGLVAAYFGMSVYVTYMRDRDDIRETVWTGENTAARLALLDAAVSSFEWFDWRNARHIERVSGRLNQNYLVGSAVLYLRQGYSEFAKGDTLVQGALAVIPRVLWPDKPIVAGSGDLVSQYTGLHFGEDTSVGIGHVMEAYVSFGTRGVVGSFFVIGLLLVLADRSAAAYRNLGDAGRFLICYLPALGLLQVGGSFVEATATAAGSYAVAILFWRLGHLLTVRAKSALDPT
ncbi:MAG: hypothetical protein ABL971_00095 [Vicinamibacterales bacterium]